MTDNDVISILTIIEKNTICLDCCLYDQCHAVQEDGKTKCMLLNAIRFMKNKSKQS